MISAKAKCFFPPFRFPANVAEEERVDFCVSVINKLRSELIPVRRIITHLTRQNIVWKQKYERAVYENGELKEENEELKKQIEKLVKTTERYRVSLFDHGNFKSPEEAGKKPQGGQNGHIDTNRERNEDYSSFTRKRIYLTNCRTCGSKLNRVKGIREKVLVDIVLSPVLSKYIIESERQWCPTCKSEALARHPQSLPFTEYGMNTFLMILILEYQCHLSFSAVSNLFTTAFGLVISESGIVNLLSQAKKYLGKRYEDLTNEARCGRIMYNDETGWQVKGKTAWMWIAANEETTVCKAAESRGRGIAESLYGDSQAFSMHDGYPAYEKVVPFNKQLYCWSHLLRFAYEETIDSPPSSPAVTLRDGLVATFRLKKENPDITGQDLETAIRKKIDQLELLKSNDPSFQKIHNRLIHQKEGLIRSLVVSPNGTNNLSEQGLRPIVISRKVSFGSDTYSGMETTAILSSIIETAKRRTNQETFLSTLKDWLVAGVKEEYPDYDYL